MSPDKKRFKILRRACLIGLIALLLLSLHFYVPTDRGLWWRIFLETLHFSVFGLVAISLFGLVSERSSWFPGVTKAFAITVVLSLLSEVVQIPTARDASLDDVLLNCSGAISFLLAITAISSRSGLAPRYRGLAAVAAIAILVFGTAPLIRVSLAYLERNHQVPVLLSLDARFGDTFIRKQNISFTRESGQYGTCARIRLGQGPWPGVALHDIWPDWSDYRTLIIDVDVDGEHAIELSVRIHDREHIHGQQLYSDRFNTRFTLEPRRHLLNIPIASVVEAPRNRQMNVRDIQSLILFSTTAYSGRSFCLHEIRLE